MICDLDLRTLEEASEEEDGRSRDVIIGKPDYVVSHQGLDTWDKEAKA